jgi:hypothetical protein
MGLTGQLRRVVGPAVRRIGARAIPVALKYAAIRDNVTRALTVSFDNIPPLQAKHLDNVRLFANRNDLISSMRSIEGGVIAEVGVAHGDFSEFLMGQLKPKRFVAFDLFNLHESRQYGHEPWWEGNAKRLNSMTHLEFYKRRFADRSAEVMTEVGMSHLTLAKYPNKSFDLIYIDADHSYEGVKKDADVAKDKVADNGFLIFNDYKIFSHTEGIYYGVVRAVNELIVNDDWVVCGFALERQMYCDIAIHKR